MSSENIRDVFKKSDLLLMGVCVALAAGFLVLAGMNAVEAGNFLTIDSIFFTGVCLLLALTFVAVPALTMRQRGVRPFYVGDEVPPARAHEHVHFEGGIKLFLNVLLGLLALTLIVPRIGEWAERPLAFLTRRRVGDAGGGFLLLSRAHPAKSTDIR